MNEVNKFQEKSCDWRGILAKNRINTFKVITFFVLIYLLVGLLIDLYIHGAFVQDQFLIVATMLLTFKMVPAFTLLMAGIAILSLMITYALHDRIMLLGTEYHEITPDAENMEEKQLYHVVEEMKIAAGLQYMPKIYLIDASYMNAFASGYSEKSAMIAVTRGLLQKLDRNELEAVIGHELSHIRHGDIRLTLTASVLSNIMLIVVDMFFYSALFGRNNDRGNTSNRFLFIIILLRYLLPVVTVLLMLYLSRTREYMADAGSVELMRDNHPLARALVKISSDHVQNESSYSAAYCQTPHENVRRAAYIFDPFCDGIHPVKSLTTLVSTHPSIPDRLKALGFNSDSISN